MKRFAATALVLASIAVLGAAQTATAAAPNATRVSLSCDRGSSASVTIVLQDSDAGQHIAAPIDLICDAPTRDKIEREVVITDFDARYAIAQPFAVGPQLCSGARSLPLKLNCADATGANATVTVR